MPYSLKTSGDGKRAVVVKTKTGEAMSKEPLPIERARAQLRALYANEPKARR